MANTRIYWLHALTPTHAGVGRGIGYIDLPIDRDAVSGWPIIRGSAFKGVWADHYTQLETVRKREENDKLRVAFGIAGNNDESNAGALIPTDARLVCLPIRSFRGTFAWCTSPLCLEFLRRTLTLAGIDTRALSKVTVGDDFALHADHSALVESGKIYLEDLDFTAEKSSAAYAWAAKIAHWVFEDATWRDQFEKRFVVLPDVAFDFLCESGTEVQTRVKIDDGTKTVSDKALWTEESLPSETILAGVVKCDRVFAAGNTGITEKSLLEDFASKTLDLQIGGKATVGRGQMHCVFTPEGGK